MRLSTVFHLSMYGLAGLASTMLAIAEGTAIPVAMTIPLIVVAFLFTERWHVLRLSPRWSNVFGLLALFLAMAEFLGDDIESRLTAGAHLLVYLMWIVLFQQKHARQHWWLCALGLLQVAVGAVLTDSGLYGGLLLVYLFSAVWTLSLFSLFQARQWFSDLVLPAETSIDIEAGAAGPTWFRPSVSRAIVQHDPNEPWLSGRFVFGTVTTYLLALGLAAVFFMLVPRIWIGRTAFGDDAAAPVRSVTGFTNEVALGDIGQILESTQRVLEVRLYDNDTDQPLDVEQVARQLGHDEPLFRGGVLDQYSRGRWTSTSLDEGPGAFRELPRNVPRGMVRQEIRLDPIGSRVLFAMHPVRTGHMEDRDDEVVYEVYTRTLFLDRAQPPSRPVTY
ncbi:MAG: DUF3488 domain-containing protein, partial [Planctomycetaceae bacterium]